MPGEAQMCNIPYDISSPWTDCLLHAPNHAQYCQQSNQAHDMMQKSPDKGQHFYIFGCAPKTLLIGLRAEPDYCSPGELCDQFQEEQDQPLHSPALVVMPPSLLIFCSAKAKCLHLGYTAKTLTSSPASEQLHVRQSHYLTYS